MEWIQENNRLILRGKNPYANKFLVGCLSIFALLFMAGFLLFGFATLGTESHTYTSIMIPAFGVSIGLLLLNTALSHLRNNFIRDVTFNNSSELVSLSENSITLFDIPYHSIKGFKIAKEIRTRTSSSSNHSGNNSYSVFLLFLIKNDGGHIWLETYMTEAEAKMNQDKISEFTGITRGGKLAASTFEGLSVTQASKFVEIKETQEGTEIFLIQKKSFSDMISISLVFFIFLGGIFIGLIELIGSFSQGGGLTIILMATFFIPFLIIFIGAVFFILFYFVLRKFRITVNSQNLIIRYDFVLPIINRYLGKDRTISVSNIRHVRVNRLDLGHFWLCVAVDSNYPETITDKMNDVGGGFEVNSLKLSDDEKLLNLWFVTGLKLLVNSPSYNDLVIIENLIEKRLHLTEKPI